MASAAIQQVRKSLDIPSLFKQFAALPSVTRAQFLPTPLVATPAAAPASPSASSTAAPVTAPTATPFAPVVVVSSHKDVLLDESRSLQQVYTWQDGSFKPFGFPSALDVIASVPSPSKRLIATMRAAPSKGAAANGKTPVYVLEITDADPASPSVGRVLHSITTAGVHGPILLNGNFGGFDWNSSEDGIVYMAEPTAEDRAVANYFPKPDEEEKQKASNEPIFPTKGTEWEAKEEWGEALVGVVRPRPFVARFNSVDGIKLHSVKGIPESVSAGQCIWSGWRESRYTANKQQDALFDEGLYMTIYTNSQGGGRKLGIAAYNSRESKVCYLSARYIVDKKREAEEKKSKEKVEREAREADDASRKQRGESRTAEEEAALKSAEYQKKHADAERERHECHLIVLTPNDHSAQSPRLDGFDSPQLVYLTTDQVWHHASCSALKTFITLPSTLPALMKLVEAPEDVAMRADGAVAVLDSVASPDTAAERPMKVFFSNTHEMVPIVQQPKDIHSFPGLWPTNNELPRAEKFVFNRSHVLLSTEWRSQNVLLLCCDEDDSLSRLPMPIDAPVGASMTLYDVDRATGRLIVGVSSLAQSPSLYIAEVRVLAQGENVAIGEDFLPVPIIHKEEGAAAPFSDFQDDDDDDDDIAYAQVKYTLLKAPMEPIHPEAARRLAGITAEIVQVPVNATYANGAPQLPFEAILVTPEIDRTKPLPPLIVFPHGGPHAATPNAFNSFVAFHVAVGASILFVNYRGSTGFGQAMLDSLPGKCGEQDVADCIAALELVLQRTGSEAVADRSNVHVQGGSHGGFLTTHLIGQHPSVFQTAVARNPVTNIAHMTSTTDIVDWCMFEATGAYDPLAMPTPADYDRMFRASPVAHLSRVQTPLLMLLGGADRRVPISQALDYIKLLKSRGVRTRTLLYPEGQHPLNSTVAMEGDVWVSMIMWALKRFDGVDMSLLGKQKA